MIYFTTYHKHKLSFITKINITTYLYYKLCVIFQQIIDHLSCKGQHSKLLKPQEPDTTCNIIGIFSSEK